MDATCLYIILYKIIVTLLTAYLSCVTNSVNQGTRDGIRAQRWLVQLDCPKIQGFKAKERREGKGKEGRSSLRIYIALKGHVVV
jgi:hypothetical protein